MSDDDDDLGLVTKPSFSTQVSAFGLWIMEKMNAEADIFCYYTSFYMNGREQVL